jgi:sugar/nucleoside kinase (ribokinase family)
MGKIVCVGNAVIDIIAKNSSDHTPDGMTVFSDNIDMHLGGDAVNQAVSLKALGNEVRLYTSVGKDSLGQAFVAMLESAGLSTEGVFTDPAYPTTATIVTIGADGEHGCMTLRNGAAGNMRYDKDLLHVDFEGADLLSIGSLFWSKGQKQEDLTALFSAAKSNGLLTSADMVLDQSQMGLDDIRDALPFIDYLVPSLHEASYFTGKEKPEDIAEVFHSMGVKNVVLKLGAKGVFGSDGQSTYYVPTIADKVVDTLGGGDNFVAGFLTGIVDGKSMEEAIYFGSAAAAIAISDYGANGVVKSRQQVESYLNNHRR